MGVSELRGTGVLLIRESYYLGVYIKGSHIFVNPHTIQTKKGVREGAGDTNHLVM